MINYRGTHYKSYWLDASRKPTQNPEVLTVDNRYLECPICVWWWSCQRIGHTHFSKRFLCSSYVEEALNKTQPSQWRKKKQQDLWENGCIDCINSAIEIIASPKIIAIFNSIKTRLQSGDLVDIDSVTKVIANPQTTALYDSIKSQLKTGNL